MLQPDHRPLARASSSDMAGSGHLRDAALHDIHEDEGAAPWDRPAGPAAPAAVELTRTRSLGRRSAGPTAGITTVRRLSHEPSPDPNGYFVPVSS